MLVPGNIVAVAGAGASYAVTVPAERADEAREILGDCTKPARPPPPRTHVSPVGGGPHGPRLADAGHGTLSGLSGSSLSTSSSPPQRTAPMLDRQRGALRTPHHLAPHPRSGLTTGRDRGPVGGDESWRSPAPVRPARTSTSGALPRDTGHQPRGRSRRSSRRCSSAPAGARRTAPVARSRIRSAAAKRDPVQKRHLGADQLTTDRSNAPAITHGPSGTLDGGVQ